MRYIILCADECGKNYYYDILYDYEQAKKEYFSSKMSWERVYIYKAEELEINTKSEKYLKDNCNPFEFVAELTKKILEIPECKDYEYEVEQAIDEFLFEEEKKDDK